MLLFSPITSASTSNDLSSITPFLINFHASFLFGNRSTDIPFSKIIQTSYISLATIPVSLSLHMRCHYFLHDLHPPLSLTFLVTDSLYVLEICNTLSPFGDWELGSFLCYTISNFFPYAVTGDFWVEKILWTFFSFVIVQNSNEISTSTFYDIRNKQNQVSFPNLCLTWQAC